MDTTGACGQFCRNTDYGLQGGALSAAAASGQGWSLFKWEVDVSVASLSIDFEFTPVRSDYYTHVENDRTFIGNGNYQTTIGWKVTVGYITIPDGADTQIEAWKPAGEMEVIVKDNKGNKLENESKSLVKQLKDAGWTNQTNCHGQTFASGSVWIPNNQVKTLMDALGYDTSNPVKTPQKGDVGLYSKDGSLASPRHSVKVNTTDSKGTVTSVTSKGGIQPLKTNIAPGPGPGTAFEPNDWKQLKLNYYRIKPSK